MDMHTSPAFSAAPSLPAAKGFTRFSLVRIALGIVATCLPVALVLVLSHQIPDKSMRAFWPPLLAALLGFGGYVLYVRTIEKRPASELRGPNVGREIGSGLALGTLLFLSAVGVSAVIGSYQLTSTGSWVALAKSFTEMVFVAVFEEILFRGVLFRLSERSLGTWPALAISSAIFALAHLPNAGITALAVGNTALAGLMFAAAYLVSRRLWLAIGMHFAWNFISDGVFSMPTSGNPAHGLLQGRIVGPEWLTGGAYGLEGSLVTLILIAFATGLLLRRASHAGHFVPRPHSKQVKS